MQQVLTIEGKPEKDLGINKILSKTLGRGFVVIMTQ